MPVRVVSGVSCCFFVLLPPGVCVFVRVAALRPGRSGWMGWATEMHNVNGGIGLG